MLEGWEIFVLTCNNDLNFVTDCWINQDSLFGDLVEAGILAPLLPLHWPHAEDPLLGMSVGHLTGRGLRDSRRHSRSLINPQQKEGRGEAVVVSRLELRLRWEGGHRALEWEHATVGYHARGGLHRQDRGRENGCEQRRVWRNGGEKKGFSLRLRVITINTSF